MVLKKLKSLLGFDDDDESDRQRDIGVTVEREPAESPDAETEAAVKGTDAGTEPDDGDDSETEPDDSTSDAAESADPSDEADEESTAEPDDAAVDDSEETEEEAGAAADVEDTDETEAEADAEDDEPPASDPVDEIKGIGPAYAERLGDAGIETIPQLAEADPESLAAETDLSEKRVSEWVERAKVR